MNRYLWWHCQDAEHTARSTAVSAKDLSRKGLPGTEEKLKKKRNSLLTVTPDAQGRTKGLIKL